MGGKSRRRILRIVRKPLRLIHKMFKYYTNGTCSKVIEFEVDEQNKLHSVQFVGGCKGNTQGVCRLVEGRNIDEVQNILSGVLCRNGTSCPDQLSRAIAEYKKSKSNS